MDLRLALALLAGRAAGWGTRRLGRGGGTVLPGHVVARLDPLALRKITLRLPTGVVLVSGTNGKTTTTRMVSQIAGKAGLSPIHNRAGANLMTGIIAAASSHADLAGHPQGDLGLFEVDEANVPAVVQAVQPRVLALLNVFRDQLDRYGEVDLVARTWREAVRILPPHATLVLNADDPIVAELADAAPCRVTTFGLETASVGSRSVPHDADKRLCPKCGHRITYSLSYYGHVGHYQCDDCGWRRPVPDIACTAIERHPAGGSELAVRVDGDELHLRVPLAGLYNAYNGLAAAAISRALGIRARETAEALSSFTGVFGRQERIALGTGEIVLALVKNPVGFNQVLQTVAPDHPPSLFVIAINDLFADGTDVSWLWDVDFETLAPLATPILCSGNRAHDMALRLKYALVHESRVTVEPDIARAASAALRVAADRGRVLVFPTYTAMLAFRGELQRRGAVTPFWDD